MGTEKKIPGVMFYVDIISSLKYFSDEEVGQIFRAALNYRDTGVLPEFDDRAMTALWSSIQEKIDRDGKKYQEKCKSGSYAAYCRYEQADGRKPLSREEWERERELDNIL